MHALVDIKKYREDKNGTDLMIYVPDMQLGDMLRKKRIQNAEIRFDDGRHISAEQRKKAYATIRDIADYTGYLPEEMKQILKYQHMIRTATLILVFLIVRWTRRGSLSIRYSNLLWKREYRCQKMQ